MKCLGNLELEEYIGGKLSAEKMLEVNQHINACKECRAQLASTPGYYTAVYHLREQLLTTSCPEYEELSDFVSGALASAQARAIERHISVCDLCSHDIQMMQELRSRSSLVPKLIVVPGLVRRPSTWKLWLPKLLPAAGAVAGVVVIFALMLFGNQHKAPNTHRSAPIIVEAPPSAMPNTTSYRSTSEQSAPNTIKPTPAPVSAPNQTPHVAIAPGPRVVAVARTDYSQLGVSQAQINRVKRAVDEKLRTGKLTVDAPVRIAMASAIDRVRARGSSFGPEPISPVSETVQSGMLTLKWRPIEGADEYRVEVTDAQGKLIASREITNTHVTIDPQYSGLLLWRVSVRLGHEDIWESGKAAAICVLTDDETRLIRRASTAYANDHLVLGTIYEMNGLYRQAEAEYEKLAQAPNHPANVNRMLVSVRSKLAK